MGYIRHDAIVAIGYWSPSESERSETELQIDELRAEMVDPKFGNDESHLLIGPIQAAVNGYTSYAYLPDGSKEYWDTSDRHNEWRERFRAILNATGRFNILTAEFGDDEPGWLVASVDAFGETEVHVNTGKGALR